MDGEDVDPAPPALRGGRAARAVSAGGDAALDDEGAPPEDVHGGAEYGCEGEVRGGGGAAWGTARAQPEARGAPRGGPGRAKPPKPADRAAARKTPKKAVVEDDDDDEEEEEEEAWVVPAAAAPKRGAAAPPLLPARATRGSGAPLVVPPPDNQWVAKYKGREVPPLLAFETNTARGAAHAATAAAAAAKPAARRAARGAAAGAEAAAAAAEQHAAFVGAGLDGILQQAGRSTRLAGGRMPPPQRAQAPQPPPKPAKKQPPKPRAPRLERVPFAGGVLEVGQLVYVTCDSGGGDGDDSMAGAGEGDGGGGRSPSDRFLAGTLRLARVEELLLATAAAGEAGGGGGGNGNGGGGGYAPASPAFSALLRWVYRPEDTQPGRQAHHPRRFVYLADGPDALDTVASHRLLPAPPPRLLPPLEFNSLEGGDAFMLTYKYDALTHAFLRAVPEDYEPARGAAAKAAAGAAARDEGGGGDDDVSGGGGSDPSASDAAASDSASTSSSGGGSDSDPDASDDDASDDAVSLEEEDEEEQGGGAGGSVRRRAKGRRGAAPAGARRAAARRPAAKQGGGGGAGCAVLAECGGAPGEGALALEDHRAGVTFPREHQQRQLARLRREAEEAAAAAAAATAAAAGDAPAAAAAAAPPQPQPPAPTSGAAALPSARFARARDALQLSHIPASLPGREAERARIRDFLLEAVRAGDALARSGPSEGGASARCLYVSGVPGTGKTATVKEVMRAALAQVRAGKLPSFRYVEVNGLRLQSPQHFYVSLWGALAGAKASPKAALASLEKRFALPSPPGNLSTVLFVDELDILVTRRQDVLYNLFEWPNRPGARLIVIGVANTLDLPERLLPRIGSRMGSKRVPFSPYTKAQLTSIVTNRLEGATAGDAFEPVAVSFAVTKVAGVSGDARRVLELCRRSAEIAEAAGLARVNAGSVQVAMREMFNSPHMSYIRDGSLHERVFLVALCKTLRQDGCDVARLEDVAAEHGSLCAAHGVTPPLLFHHLVRIALNLSAVKIIDASPGLARADMMLQLNPPSADIATALEEDKQLPWATEAASGIPRPQAQAPEE